jgi:malate dehydrogenase (oxaloacetate-decarboxylating)
MKQSAALALAALIPDEELRPDYIIPSPLDKRAAQAVADAVAEEAKRCGNTRF